MKMMMMMINRPDVVILGITMKEVYLIGVGNPNIHILYSTITKRLQKYTYLKEELTKM